MPDEVARPEGCHMTDPRDVQIHIHEHVGPLRERVGRIEGQMEVHDRELSLLRQGLESLRGRIDEARNAMIAALEVHAADEMKRYETISTCVNQLNSKMNWIIGVGVGLGVFMAILELLIRSNMLTHGHP